MAKVINTRKITVSAAAVTAVTALAIGASAPVSAHASQDWHRDVSATQANAAGYHDGDKKWQGHENGDDNMMDEENLPMRMQSVLQEHAADRKSVV